MNIPGLGPGFAHNNVMYCFSRYATELNLTVHVGSLFFRDTLLQNRNQAETKNSVDDNINKNNQMSINFKDSVKHDINANDRIIFRVTVIIPVRNGQRYLRECLYSLLSLPQDCGPFEVILIDDGSIDGTAEIAENVRQEVHSGTFSLNPGVYHCIILFQVYFFMLRIILPLTCLEWITNLLS